MNLDFTFGQSDWELALGAYKQGETISAVRLLALLEGEDEAEAESAFQFLEERRITLDIQDLPAPTVSGELKDRLRREAQLVKSGTLLQALEENDPLRLYLEEIARIPAAGDPDLLARRCAEGDEEAASGLVNLLLSLVVEEALTLTGRGVLLQDLIQEGSLGLWQGVLCYQSGDVEQHCLWWIRQYLAKIVTVHARAGDTGQKLRQAVEDYRDADRKLLTQLGRNPTLEEIADYLRISGEEAAVLEKMLLNARAAERIKTEQKNDAPAEEEDQAVENTAYFQSRQRIQEMLATLDTQEAQLISLRYGLEGGLPMDPQQVGRKLGLTAEEVVKKEAAALEKLRQQ